MHSKQLIPAFKDDLKWVPEQAGKKRPTRADRDRVENLSAAGLACLMDSPDSTRYRDWFDRQGFVEAFRNRNRAFFQKKWNRLFARFVSLVISDLEALPRLTQVSHGAEKKPLSDAKKAALKKAHAARRRKQAEQPVSIGQVSEVGPIENGKNGVKKPLVFKGLCDPKSRLFPFGPKLERRHYANH